MDTKKISALITAVQCGSLSSAAEQLGYTQSGLTHMMNSLEDETGISLLIRNKSGVRLSQDGLELIPKMQHLLDAANELEAAFETIKKRKIISFRVGAYSSVARHWLPSIVAGFKSSSPETDMYLSMQDIQKTYDAVKNGELDCAIASYQPQFISSLSWFPLKDDELVAILPGTYSIEDGLFPPRYFAGMDFLMPSGGFDLDIMPIFEGLPPSQLPLFRYTNMDDAAIVSMVSHGLGVSIMSRLVMQGISENVAIVPLGPRSFRKLGFITTEHRKDDSTLCSFIESARRTIANL